MSKKLFSLLSFILIILTFILVSSTTNDENENKNFHFKMKMNKNSGDDDLYVSNPYTVLRIPPWTKFEDVKKRYEKIKDKAYNSNKQNSKRFKLITKAYDEIYETYKKNNYKDISFFEVLWETIKNIFIYEIAMLSILFITWFVYKFNTYAAVLVMSFVAIDNIIPHWFGTMIAQYIFSFIVGTFLYFNDYIRAFIFGKKNEVNNNNNNVEQVNRRRRFVKYE